MERKRRGFLLAVVCASVVFASWATNASAQATTVPIAGFGFTVALVDPGTSFLSDGILHVRNQVQVVQLIGDLQGLQTVTLSLERNEATLAGRVHGVLSFSGTHVPSGRNGTFEGTFVGDLVPDPSVPCGAIVRVNGPGQNGAGDFAGMKRFFQAVNVCGFVNYGGYILDPSGNLLP